MFCICSGTLEAREFSSQEHEAMDFLVANMTHRDRKMLHEDFLLENIKFAYQAINEVPWGKDIPKDIFLNDVLPYASVNETRDNWRQNFYHRFIQIAKTSKDIKSAVLRLNKEVFKALDVNYNPNKRPKAEQSPYESIKVKYASCTGLSILLVDALRSVGIPARLAGIYAWPDDGGNHTWVEFWDGQWHYIGASESTVIDQAWFSEKASKLDKDHLIFAVSFKKTGKYFPMRWARRMKDIPAVDVTKNYRR